MAGRKVGGRWDHMTREVQSHDWEERWDHMTKGIWSHDCIPSPYWWVWSWHEATHQTPWTPLPGIQTGHHCCMNTGTQYSPAGGGGGGGGGGG